MFIRQFDLKILSFIVLCAGFTATPAVSADTNVQDLEYFRFLTRAPDVTVSEGGEKADIIIEYFANRSGDVAGVSFAAISPISNNTCEVFFNDSDICWCEGAPADQIACLGDNNGPAGGAVLAAGLDVSVVPQMDKEGSIDFSVKIQRTIVEQVDDKFVPGFDISDDGEVSFKEANQ